MAFAYSNPKLKNVSEAKNSTETHAQKVFTIT